MQIQFLSQINFNVPLTFYQNVSCFLTDVIRVQKPERIIN